jgi:cyanate lyase
MDRKAATEKIMQAKSQKGVTFEQISEKVGRDKVWVTAALFGQATMAADEAKAVADYLDLDDGVSVALQEIPMRGSLDAAVPVDPLIYRLYEIVQVYGTSIKALVHEMYGDGIVSAIDFTMDIKKKPDPHGDRVVITLDGKFLPYKKW